MSAVLIPTRRSATAGAGFPEPILALPNNAQVVLASHWRVQELLRRKYSGSPSPRWVLIKGLSPSAVGWGHQQVCFCFGFKVRGWLQFHGSAEDSNCAINISRLQWSWDGLVGSDTSCDTAPHREGSAATLGRSGYEWAASRPRQSDPLAARTAPVGIVPTCCCPVLSVRAKGDGTHLRIMVHTCELLTRSRLPDPCGIVHVTRGDLCLKGFLADGTYN